MQRILARDRTNQDMNMLDIIALGTPPVQCAQAGNAKKVQGTALFVRSEKGWQALPPQPGLIMVREIQE